MRLTLGLRNWVGGVCWGYLTRVVVTEMGGKVSYERWFGGGAVAEAAIFYVNEQKKQGAVSEKGLMTFSSAIES